MGTNSDKNKKEMERHQLIKFISNEKLKLLVHDLKDSETPDFSMTVNGKNISIEHTRLINPELKKIEEYRVKIISNSQKLFEEKYSEKLYVLITFNNIQLQSGKIAEQQYTKEVFDLIESIYLNNKSYRFNISSRRTKVVSELIDSFSVENKSNFNNWQHFGAYLVEWVDMNWLQNIIFKKENNISKYSQKFDENWLLMVSDFGTKSSSNRFEGLNYYGIKSKFDKIYIYSFGADEIEVVK